MDATEVRTAVDELRREAGQMRAELSRAIDTRATTESVITELAQKPDRKELQGEAFAVCLSLIVCAFNIVRWCLCVCRCRRVVAGVQGRAVRPCT